MGLVILGALARYLLLSILVVYGAIKHAKKAGKSTKRWGWGAALAMYLILFWDWIPTMAVQQPVGWGEPANPNTKHRDQLIPRSCR